MTDKPNIFGSAKELAKYEIGEIRIHPNEYSFWTVHKGKIKASGEEVSIFAFDIKAHKPDKVKAASNAFKKIKTTRHPSLLTFLDGFENESYIYIITPPVERLSNLLSAQSSDGSKDNKMQFSSRDWGLFKLANVLQFLNVDCKMVHNNINMHSVYVDKAGEWNLFGLEYSYPFNNSNNNTYISYTSVNSKPRVLEKYDAPEVSTLTASKSSGIKNIEAWSIDIWGFACLIWELFNGELKQKSSLKHTNKLAKELVPLYCEMMNSDPASRLSPAKFLERARATRNGYLNTPCLSAMMFLDEIQMKGVDERKKFFTGELPKLLDSFSPDISRHKILPALVQAFEYCDAGTSILPALFKLGELLEEVDYEKFIIPCVVKLYGSPDRNTRMALLRQLDVYASKLKPAVVNDSIFTHLITGFTDTNPVLKESTIKGMVYLAPKLNYNNLNVELVRHFARLQGTDPHGGIRTNTTICMGKIAQYFDPRIRQKILISAFTRPFKDDFGASRKAALQALAATAQFYVIEDLGKKVLPMVCMLTVDPEKEIRELAFEVIADFTKKLKEVSDNPERMAEYDATAMTSKLSECPGSTIEKLQQGLNAGRALGWVASGGWAAVTTITSKLYKGEKGDAASSKISAEAERKGKNEENRIGELVKRALVERVDTCEDKLAGGLAVDTYQGGNDEPEQSEDETPWEGLEDLGISGKGDLKNGGGNESNALRDESAWLSPQQAKSRPASTKNQDDTLDAILKEEGFINSSRTSSNSIKLSGTRPKAFSGTILKPTTKSLSANKKQHQHLVAEDPWTSWAFDK